MKAFLEEMYVTVDRKRLLGQGRIHKFKQTTVIGFLESKNNGYTHPVPW